MRVSRICPGDVFVAARCNPACRKKWQYHVKTVEATRVVFSLHDRRGVPVMTEGLIQPHPRTLAVSVDFLMDPGAKYVCVRARDEEQETQPSYAPDVYQPPPRQRAQRALVVG